MRSTTADERLRARHRALTERLDRLRAQRQRARLEFQQTLATLQGRQELLRRRVGLSAPVS